MFSKNNKKNEPNIIATLAVMESQLLQSLEHQKSIKERINTLSGDMNDIKVQIKTLEQASSSCDRQVFDNLQKMELRIDNIEAKCQENKKCLDEASQHNHSTSTHISTVYMTIVHASRNIHHQLFL